MSEFCYSVKKWIKKKEEEEEKKLQARRREKSFRLGRPFCGKSIHIFLRSTLRSWGEAESARLLSDTQKISAEKKGRRRRKLYHSSEHSFMNFFVDYESIKKLSTIIVLDI